MTTRNTSVFRPGEFNSKRTLLERFLPPLFQGIATSWLEELHSLNSDGWILDPFGASPQLAVEIAAAGHQVLVAANNPINRFLLEVAANPARPENLRAVLAELSASRIGGERLEPLIRGVYRTTCQQCGQPVEAQAFLWEREAAVPYARIYHCPHCGDSGERPATRMDEELAAGFATGGLHRARALERIAPANDPDRPHAEEALAVYLPRAVYVLFTLINKMEGLNLPPTQKKWLLSLLLHACDQANTLWPYPTARARPRQLTIPPRFRENNIWMALEKAIDWLSVDQQAVNLWTWPDTSPGSAGIVLFEGRLRDLADSLKELSISAVVTAIPRPNQAFWTLSALWAGWLWGSEAVGPFKSVLRRRRYDWAWHTSALTSAFSHLSSSLPKATPMFGLIGETEPGFLTSGMISTDLAGFDLRGLALRAEYSQTQLDWTLAEPAPQIQATQPRSGQLSKVDNKTNSPSNDIVETLKGVVTNAARRHLLTRGEPALYLHLHAAVLLSVTLEHLLRESSAEAIELINSLNESLEKGLTYQKGLLRFEGSDKSLEIGQWWLRVPPHTADQPEVLPLSDRIELSAVQYLQKHHGCMLSELDQALCAEFPGLLTPDPQLVLLCLDSYADEVAPESAEWQLRPQDHTAARRKDLLAIRSVLRILGGRLGFFPEGEQPLLWVDQSGEVAYSFFFFASAAFGSTVTSASGPLGRPLLVLPGGRANLALYKLNHNAYLKKAIEDQGWRFLKFRHVRRLIDNSLLDQDMFEEQLDLDPLKDATPQMRLL